MAVPMTFATQGRIEGLLDPAILDRFLSLDQGGKCNAEYVWLGGTGADLRSKTKTLDKAPDSLKDLPTWNFDGSSTNQAPGVLLVAVMEAAGTLAACGCIDRKPEHACWWPLPCSAAGPRSAGTRQGWGISARVRRYGIIVACPRSHRAVRTIWRSASSALGCSRRVVGSCLCAALHSTAQPGNYGP